MRSSIPIVALLGVSANAMILPRGNDNQTAVTSCGATGVADYTVKFGDTLTSIAQSFKSGICNIKYYNDIDDIDYIPAGANYKIPTDCTTPDNESCKKNKPGPPPANNTCVPGVGSSYDVRANDSLTKIAAAFEITLASLEAANPQVTDPNAIDVGQNLHIPICPNSKCESIGTYVVKTGDTFYLLAQQYKTTPGQIEVVNVGVVPENVPAGATIILPQNCHNVTAAC